MTSGWITTTGSSVLTGGLRIVDPLPAVVRVGELKALRPEDESLLDPVECERARSARRAQDRARFVLGVALLKRTVAEVTGKSAGAVRLERRCPDCGGPHGRPEVRGGGVHVSVSHSGSLVAVAVSATGPVGVDIESRARSGALPPIDRIVTAHEPLTRPSDLLTYWCRKESALKATGDGLRKPVTEVIVTRPAEPARLLAFCGERLAASMADLDCGPGYVGAVTVLTDRTDRE